MFVSTNAVVNSGNSAGTTINFERILGLPDTAQRGFVEAYFRLARRHQLSASYTRLNRTGETRALTGDINWGGAAFPAGVAATGAFDSSFVSGAYRFAVYRNPRFEVGPAVGFGYLWLTAAINSTFNLGTLSTTISREVTESTPTGDIGGYANWWLARRVYVRGDIRYILIKPTDTEASIGESRVGVTWYAWRHVGIGGQFDYAKFRFDRDVRSTSLGGTYRYSGIEVLASLAF